MDFQQSGRNLQTVFREWRYALLAIVIAGFFYAFNALLLNFRVVVGAFGVHGFDAFRLYWNFIVGYKNVIAFHSFVTLVIISVLFGILFSLILYKTIQFSERKHLGFWDSFGIFLGVLAPGCAACGIGVFSVIGISAATMTFLPFRGLEISLLAIAVLTYSIMRFAQDITTCRITRLA